jgi:AcrR family transcriptional regulator
MSMGASGIVVTDDVFVTLKVTSNITAGKRAYSSDLRTEQARRTRRQIVAAAGELFAASGYAATTIEAIAERAGVSRKTVFTAVGGKPVLIKLAYDWAVVGDDEEIPLVERERIMKMRQETDPVVIMEAYSRHYAETVVRVAPLYLALRNAADGDDEARALFAEVQAERLRGMRMFAEQLSRIGGLRPGLSVRRANDLLFFYIDPAHYELLVLTRGWSVAAFREWFLSSLRLHLLGLGG